MTVKAVAKILLEDGKTSELEVVDLMFNFVLANLKEKIKEELDFSFSDWKSVTIEVTRV